MAMIYTSRITYDGIDRLDVSRSGNDPIGRVFAPSWPLLRPHLERRRHRVISIDDWDSYVDSYIEEMRKSYRSNKTIWDTVAARDRVTFCCFCKSARHCHRTVLARLLERIGATYRGER